MPPRTRLYDNPADAYKDLEKADPRYAAYEARAEGDLVLVLFPETGIARLFANLQEVGRRYNWSIYMRHVYVSPQHLSAKLPTQTLRDLGERVGLTNAETASSIEMAQVLWGHYQAHGDRVTNSNLNGSSNSDETDKYLVRVDLLKSEEMAQLLTTLPRQAQILAQALADAGRTTYTEDELAKLAGHLVVEGKLKTKQDPFRVMAYYLPTLYDLGVVSYNSRRVKEKEEA